MMVNLYPCSVNTQKLYFIYEYTFLNLRPYYYDIFCVIAKTKFCVAFVLRNI